MQSISKISSESVAKPDIKRETQDMPPPIKSKISDFFANEVYPRVIDVLVGLSILALALWMFAGILRLVLDAASSLNLDWATAAERALTKALVILALLEVIRTLQAYLKVGRVRVTFILDTALVVLIGELMGLWFKDYTPEKVFLGLLVIVSLVALRIVTARHSPESV